MSFWFEVFQLYPSVFFSLSSTPGNDECALSVWTCPIQFVQCVWALPHTERGRGGVPFTAHKRTLTCLLQTSTLWITSLGPFPAFLLMYLVTFRILKLGYFFSLCVLFLTLCCDIKGSKLHYLCWSLPRLDTLSPSRISSVVESLPDKGNYPVK